MNNTCLKSKRVKSKEVIYASLLGLIAFAGTSMLACGGGSSSDSIGGSPALSQADANALATQIASAMSQGFSSGGGDAVRPLGKAQPGPQNSSSCSASGSTVVCTFSDSTACPEGGSMDLFGSASGSEDNNGNGSIGFAANVLPVNCGIEGNVFNGDLSITGNWAIVSGQLSSSLSLSESGNLTWGGNGNESCAIQLMANFDFTNDIGSANGTVCGQNVNVSF
jgi:hypothetical protein